MKKPCRCKRTFIREILSEGQDFPKVFGFQYTQAVCLKHKYVFWSVQEPIYFTTAYKRFTNAKA